MRYLICLAVMVIAPFTMVCAESSPVVDGTFTSGETQAEENPTLNQRSEAKPSTYASEERDSTAAVPQHQPAEAASEDPSNTSSTSEAADDNQSTVSKVGGGEFVHSGPVRGDLGLGLTVGMGLNICGPRGEASCTDLVPGPFLSAGFEYRFWRMGVGLNYAQGRHFVIGTGADEVEISTTHFTLDILGFFPMWRTFEPFVAVGLGYGQMLSEDSAQQSSVEWSSLWQTGHLRAGVRHRFPEGWALGSDWFWTLYGAAYLHQGGERCVFYAAQGACRLSEELPDGQTDYATTVELGGQIGYGF